MPLCALAVVESAEARQAALTVGLRSALASTRLAAAPPTGSRGRDDLFMALGFASRPTLAARRARYSMRSRLRLGARDAGELARWAEEHVTADQRTELFRVVVDTAGTGDVTASKLLHGSAMDIAVATIALATWIDMGRTACLLTGH